MSLQGAHVYTHTVCVFMLGDTSYDPFPLPVKEDRPVQGDSEEPFQGSHGWCSLLRVAGLLESLGKAIGTEVRPDMPNCRPSLGRCRANTRPQEKHFWLSSQARTYSFLFTHGLSSERPRVLPIHSSPLHER